jgi:glycine cleavage system transcriptional repressor
VTGAATGSNLGATAPCSSAAGDGTCSLAVAAAREAELRLPQLGTNASAARVRSTAVADPSRFPMLVLYTALLRAPTGLSGSSLARLPVTVRKMESPEKQYLVMTAIGQDRPGLVERVSSLIHAAGANLEDSRMAILGGEFALLVLMTGTPRALAAIQKQSKALELELGLQIGLRSTDKQSFQSDYLPYELRINGVDRPGIVARVTAVLAARQVNVAALDSKVTYAALTGTPLFWLDAQIQVPSEVALATLRGELSRVCDAENLDFQLESKR